MKILEYLLLLLPLLWELVTDFYRIEIQQKEDNHTEDVWVRTGLCVAVGIACRYWFDRNAIQGLIFSGCMFITFFDYVLNLVRILNGRKISIFHKGKSKTDQYILTHLPIPGEILARIWVFSVGYGVYYHWDLIFTR